MLWENDQMRVAVCSSAGLGQIVFMSKSAALKESAEESRRLIRDADNLFVA